MTPLHSIFYIVCLFIFCQIVNVSEISSNSVWHVFSSFFEILQRKVYVYEYISNIFSRRRQAQEHQTDTLSGRSHKPFYTIHISLIDGLRVDSLTFAVQDVACFQSVCPDGSPAPVPPSGCCPDTSQCLVLSYPAMDWLRWTKHTPAIISCNLFRGNISWLLLQTELN